MKLPLTALLLVVGAAALAAIDVTDATGTVVHLAKAPQAVVSLTLMTDEFLTDLVPASRILAYSRSVDDPVLSNVTRAKEVKGRAWLDLELLVKLKADLILAADWSSSNELKFLRDKGFAVFVVKTPTSWGAVKATVSQLGSVLGVPEAASAVLARLAAQEATLADLRKKIVRPASVLEYNSFGSAMAKGTLFPEMVGLAGLVDASASLTPDNYGFAPVTMELLLKLNPDWLVLPTQDTLVAYGTPDFLKTLQADPLFQALSAVRNKHLISLPDSVKTTVSPYVLDTAFRLFHAAYPDLR